jgi:hypothetical protein
MKLNTKTERLVACQNRGREDERCRLLGAGHWLLANRGVEREGSVVGEGNMKGKEWHGRFMARRSGCTRRGRRAHFAWREKEGHTRCSRRQQQHLQAVTTIESRAVCY